MSWADAVTRVASLAKTINNLELQFKQQDEEITRLRRENADLRKDMAGMAERLARLEEARKTTAAEVKLALSETLMELKMKAVLEENEALKRQQIPPTDSNPQP